ncbi:MAG TPA: tyrosine-type recombinase/integrase [Candidatus Limnocylindrales bacterium]
MDPDSIALADVIEAYLADGRRRRLRPATLRAYRYVLERYAAFVGPGATLARLSLADGRAYLDTCLEQVAAISAHGFGTALKTFAVWCTDEEYFAASPLLRLRLPRVDSEPLAVFSDGQLAALLRVAPARHQVLVMTFAGTGIRVGELCRLDLDDVGVADLRIRETKTRVGRVVPIDAALARLLRRYVRELRPTPAEPDERALFLTRRRTRMTEDSARDILAILGRKAGIRGVRVSPHTFRHWFAHDLIVNGTHPIVAAARGGWKTQTMLARYAVATADDVRADVARYAPASRLVEAGILRREAGRRLT